MTTVEPPAGADRAALDETAARLVELGRDLAAATMAFHTEVADQLGLSVTDHKCLDLIQRANGELTAGRIAEISCLSTGTVTGVIDRLERAGFVRRARDRRDRRKVFVRLVSPPPGELMSYFAGLSRRMEVAASRYEAGELHAIETYVREMLAALRIETTHIRDGVTSPGTG